MVKEPPSRRAQMRKKEEAAVVVYGAKKGDKTLAMSAKHTSAGPPKRSTLEALCAEALAPVVGELAALEKEIQRHGRQIRGSTAAEADLRQGDVRASGCPRAFCMWFRDVPCSRFKLGICGALPRTVPLAWRTSSQRVGSGERSHA